MSLKFIEVTNKEVIIKEGTEILIPSQYWGSAVTKVAFHSPF